MGDSNGGGTGAPPAPLTLAPELRWTSGAVSQSDLLILVGMLAGTSGDPRPKHGTLLALRQSAKASAPQHDGQLDGGGHGWTQTGAAMSLPAACSRYRSGQERRWRL